jgi:hypothetical protein
VTVEAVQAPALQLRKSAAPRTYAAVGDGITYSYRVTNSGNVRLAGPVRVADDRVDVDCPAVTSVGDGDAYLDPLEEIVCSASHTVRQADLNRGSITNTATATADGTTSAPDTVTVEAVQAPVDAVVAPALPCEWTSLTFSASPGRVAYPLRHVTVTANGRLVEGCTFSFSLASYRVEGPTWRTSGRQRFVDHDGAVLDNERPSVSLNVRTSPCYGQTSFYPGQQVYDGFSGPLPRYPDSPVPDATVSWSIGGNACESDPPRVTPPSVRFATGRKVHRNGNIPVVSRWAARDAGSGIASGMGQRRSLAGPWRPFTRLHGPVSVTTSWLSPVESPFHQRARATDRAGNTSAWAAAPWFSLRTLQGDGPGRISWSGAWKPIQGRLLLDGHAWRSSTRGDRLDVRLSATATGVALVASVGPGAGRVRVIVDGVVGPVIDLRSPVVLHRLIVWSSHLRGHRPHDISFVVLGRTSSGAATSSAQLDAVLAIGDLGSSWTHGSPRTDATKRSAGSSGSDNSSEPSSPPEASHQAGADDPQMTGASPGDEGSPEAVNSPEAASSPEGEAAGDEGSPSVPTAP